MPRDTYYITTPIYYLNGSPHIGHAYTTIAADAASRFQRMRGRDVRFLTGTDEHGTKVMEAAQARGMEPKDHTDELVEEWKGVMGRLDLTYDRWIRTTDADHEALVQTVLQQLWDAGEIYASDYEGWYLVKEEVFVTDKDREERIGSGELQESDFRRIKEANYFFRMGKYQQALVDHIEAHPTFIQPDSRRNEVLGFLRGELGDLCISRPRARLPWGIPLPFDADYVCYVWFDALLNYLTGTGYTGEGAGALPRWWPADVHLIGKDILTTHAVYWTTMLMGMGVPLPRQIFAHGWWVDQDGAKMGKSAGNAMNVDLLREAFGVDAVRYFVLREIRFGADGGFSYEGFLTRYNADLANDFGNLAHRALSMTTNWLGGTVPPRTQPDAELSGLATQTVSAFDQAMDTLQFNQAIEAVFDIVKAGNKFVDTHEPWALNKRGETEALQSVMRDVLEVCALAATLLHPVMPGRCDELLAKLGLDPAANTDRYAALVAGQGGLDQLSVGAALQTGDPLFPRHKELPVGIAALFVKENPVSDDADIGLPDLEWIEYPDFAKVLLKVGRVLEASPHPNADKLLVMKVDVGEARPRTICAGIKSAFEPAELVGRNVVVVANLKPRKLRGIASEGMLLAASNDGGVLDLVSAQAEPGDRIS